MPRRATSAGRSWVMSCPLNRMVPEVGARNLVSRLKVVVLPAPLGPISPWMTPRRTLRLTLSTATKPLNSFARPRASRMISPLIDDRTPSVLRRRAFLQERVHPLAAFVVGEAGGDRAGGELVGPRRAELHLLVERALARG